MASCEARADASKIGILLGHVPDPAANSDAIEISILIVIAVSVR